MRNIPFGKPIIGKEEKEAVARVLEGTTLVHGPLAKEFEQAFAAYTKAPFAISVSSCTAGLHLAYFYYGIKPGDEIIVPAQTHVATAHAVEFCGAKPVFVDAEKNTGNIDIDQIEAHITAKTKAISVVHYLGMPVDMDRINAIAKKHNLYVIEDCALAIGTYYNGIHAGLHGDLGCYSFYPVKHMTTTEGGMILTKHEQLAAKVQRQKAFGVDRTVGERKVPGVYDVTMLGYNYRLNEVQAAMGIEQVKRLDSFLAKRKENYEALNSGLKSLNEVSLLQSSYGKFQSSYYCLSLILNKEWADKRFEIVSILNEQGIGTSVYYPKPVPHMQYYREKYGYTETSFPVASLISYNSIALPVGPHLSVDDMNYIVEGVKNALVKVKNHVYA